MIDTAALEIAAELLMTCQNGIAFTGAGISTSSGIPDFRSPESGLWEDETAVTAASFRGFRDHPQRFYDCLRPLIIQIMSAQPNAAHYALAHLEEKGFLKGVITQNIDMLHTQAGTKTIYEVHGHMREATCLSCYRVYPCEEAFKQSLLDHRVPLCSHCGGVLKPNIILMGEQLPYRAWQGAKNAARCCDLMLIVGSSLEVVPVGDLPRLAKSHGAKVILINLQPTDQDTLADVVIHADAAVVLPAIVTCLEKFS